MKLINPNLGEAMDRLTILERKIVEGHYQRLPTKTFRDEADAIYHYLRGIGVSLSFTPIYLKLAAVNAMIWDATDRMRLAISSGLVGQMAEVGSLIFKLNNHRASLVAQLARDSGSSDPEKLYDLPDQDPV